MRRPVMRPSCAIEVSWPVDTIRFLSAIGPIANGEKRWGKRESEGMQLSPIDGIEGVEDFSSVALVSERCVLGKPDHIPRGSFDRAFAVLTDAQTESAFKNDDH